MIQSDAYCLAASHGKDTSRALSTIRDYDGAFANPKKVNHQLRLLWIGVGSDDFLLAQVKESHAILEKAGIEHVWVESSGAHVWTVWRKYLADFAPRLFQ